MCLLTILFHTMNGPVTIYDIDQESAHNLVV